MKRLTPVLLALAVLVSACGLLQPPPNPNVESVKTILAASPTPLPSNTPLPPTLAPVATFTPNPASFLTPMPSPVVINPGSDEGPYRIEFPAGGISATVKGTVEFPNRVEYVLRAMKGQRMTVQILSADNSANFAVRGVSTNEPLKRLENEDRTWDGLLPQNQDYMISVAVPAGSVDFTLFITIIWP